jgi:sortase A
VRAGRWLVGAAGELLITLGVLLILFVAWQLWWTDVAAGRVQDATVQSLSRDFRGPPVAPAPDGPATEQPAAVEFGEAFAILRIPRFGGDYARPVLEGTGTEVLEDGVGHYAGTAMPGKVGNLALAGHRTTYGRPFHDIDKLRKGDVVLVETKTSYAVYAVQRHAIVDPGAVEVIAPVPDQPGAKPAEAWLTMTACHPKYSAAQRYIVHAKLVQVYPRDAGLPEGTLAVPGGDAR